MKKNLESNLVHPYTFKIYMISDPAVNAFATPGGYIFVHTGLMIAMENESQLAGVISHEIAHITNRHIAKRIERSQKITVTSLLTGLAGLALGPAGIGVLLGSLSVGQNSMLYFSRISPMASRGDDNNNDIYVYKNIEISKSGNEYFININDIKNWCVIEHNGEKIVNIFGQKDNYSAALKKGLYNIKIDNDECSINIE